MLSIYLYKLCFNMFFSNILNCTQFFVQALAFFKIKYFWANSVTTFSCDWMVIHFMLQSLPLTFDLTGSNLLVLPNVHLNACRWTWTPTCSVTQSSASSESSARWSVSKSFRCFPVNAANQRNHFKPRHSEMWANMGTEAKHMYTNIHKHTTTAYSDKLLLI